MPIYNPSAGGGGAAISAAGASASNGTVVFSNSNGVSFGMNGSTVTASAAAGGGSVNFSAGTTSNNLGSIVFANSNGLSFGLNGSTITGTVATNYLTTAMLSNAGLSIGVTDSGATLGTSGTVGGVGVVYLLPATPLFFSQSINGQSATISMFARGPIVSNVGNTSGDTGTWAGRVVYAGGNNITLSVSSVAATQSGMALTQQTVTISGPHTTQFLTTAMASNRGSDFVAATAGFNGTNASGTLASNAWSVSVAAQTNQTIGIYASSNTTMTSSGTLDARSLSFRGAGIASVGYSANEVLISVPAGAPSPVNFSAGTTSNNLGSVVFSNSNGVSFGLNGSTVTATVQTNYLTTAALSNHSHGNPTLNLTNLSGTTASASDGFTLSLSAAAAGGGYTLSTYEPWPLVGLSTALVGVPTATSAGISVFPFSVYANVSAGIMNMMYSMSFVTNGTSSGRQTAGLAFAIYTRNVSTLSSLVSGSLSWQVTASNSTISINQITSTGYAGFGATAQTTSAGLNITSGYTGMKLFGWPINTLLTPGPYWLALIGTNSTSSINVGISVSVAGAAVNNASHQSLAPMGSFSSAFSTGQDPRGGRWHVGQGSWTSAGSVTMVPASMNFASISQAILTYPNLKFWST